MLNCKNIIFLLFYILVFPLDYLSPDFLIYTSPFILLPVQKNNRTTLFHEKSYQGFHKLSHEISILIHLLIPVIRSCMYVVFLNKSTPVSKDTYIALLLFCY